MTTLIVFAFFSGVITILAPCIWPLLPLLLSASTGEGKWRPLGIVSGIVASFTFFTLFLAYILRVLPIPPDIFRTIAVVIIIFLGLTLLIPALNKKLESWVSAFSGKFGSSHKKRLGFTGGFTSGVLLGALWTPCAGPILAAVATLAATRAVTLEAFLVTFVFAIGVGIPLLILAHLGQNFFAKSRKLSPYTARIQQVFGAIMIVVAFLIFFGYDKVLQAKVLDFFPSYGNALYFLEESDAVKNNLEKLQEDTQNTSLQQQDSSPQSEKGGSYKDAPEIRGIQEWINSRPLTLEELRGKVVLIDFWTYSCINCIRTLPYVTDWYETYKDDGFVVIGVHTPEFAFERETRNVEQAIHRYGITYPVAQDNDYEIWKAYKNRYWPAHYLIDAQGKIRYTHFGEGEYEKTESMIRTLLKEAGDNPDNAPLVQEEKAISSSRFMQRTPETYVGADRMEYHFPEKRVSLGKHTFSLEKNIPKNKFSFGGTWEIENEKSIAQKDALLQLHFSGAQVFLVMSPPESGVGRVHVVLDGEEISTDWAGEDVKEGYVEIREERLYHLIDFDDNASDHVLTLEFETPGIQAFAFTFG